MKNNLLSIQDLKSSVYKKYDVICFEDLADVVTAHSKIYKLFKQLHQDCYQDNQRLCFFTSHKPSDKILEHVQRAAARVDISNFFIKIYCAHDIRDNLSRANSKYGYDDVAIGSECVEIEPTQLLEDCHIADYRNLCPMPWIGMFVDATSSVTPCCLYKKSIGNLRTTSATDILFNNDFDQLRQSIRNGQQPSECSSCWKNEQQGTTSYRQYFLIKYNDRFHSDYIDNPTVKTLTIVPNITCNFKCRICSDQASSSIAVENIAYETDQHVINKMKFQLKQKVGNDSFLTLYQPLYQNLDDIHILGGEPFLLPTLKEFLHNIIDSGNADHIQMELNTNGSRYDQAVIDLLAKFVSAEILFSIDDIGQRFEVQRGSSWNLICDNIKQILKHKSDNVTTKLEVAVNIQNVFYLDELVDFAENLGLEIVWNYVLNPDYFCIDYMTPAAKNLVWKKFQNSPYSQLKKIAERVKHSVGSDGKDFVNHTLAYDQKRNQKFSDSHPEIFIAMNQ
jgi:MoaA/NifB/PqqE/SkfB family radical SAM enzyme